MSCWPKAARASKPCAVSGSRPSTSSLGINSRTCLTNSARKPRSSSPWTRLSTWDSNRASPSSKSSTTHGASVAPEAFRALSLWLPASSSYAPPSTGRTTRFCTSPYRLSDLFSLAPMAPSMWLGFHGAAISRSTGRLVNSIAVTSGSGYQQRTRAACGSVSGSYLGGGRFRQRSRQVQCLGVALLNEVPGPVENISFGVGLAFHVYKERHRNVSFRQRSSDTLQLAF
uniref:Uncharacterized protein n=1 Tax=uncultured marine microorganism HF4000_005H07 TaxID=455506 RepID=B3T0C9_9ZZZZ|nr:hypothetical protein ALOHA_HF4000005H07ctg1g6 [uncultured marine microorganism HF4000_005H07]